MGEQIDWTIDPETGKSNSSELYLSLVQEVERLIRNQAHDLISGNANGVARLIVSQLAHQHGLSPLVDKADTVELPK